MSKRSDERYKLVASFHSAAGYATIVVGFIRPAIESHGQHIDPATIYDPWWSLLVGLVLLGVGLAWLQGVDE